MLVNHQVFGQTTYIQDVVNSTYVYIYIYMGVSENSVPLNPLVLLIIIPIKWLFHWEYTLFSDKPIYLYASNYI